MATKKGRNRGSHILKASPKRQKWEKKVKLHTLGIPSEKEKKGILDGHPTRL